MASATQPTLAQTLDTLLQQDDPVAVGITLQQLAPLAAADPRTLLDWVDQFADPLSQQDPAMIAAMIRLTHAAVMGSARPGDGTWPVEPIARWISLLPMGCANRHLLLQLLAAHGSPAAVQGLVILLAEDPPEAWLEAAQVLSPLMQYDHWPANMLFPQAIDLIAHPSLAAPLLDLASDLFRRREVRPHPLVDQAAMLHRLLGEVTMRLERFEEDPRSFGDDVEQVGQRLGAAVALAVSLCDNIGLIGDKAGIGKLNQTVQLKHRRVQCEAAGALASLGEALGRERLIELSKDPAARLRAIAYADELGFGEKIDDGLRTRESTAEAEMAIWLSQPSQMGVPPTRLETIHSRTLSWPGFEAPVDVHLVHFEYNFGDRTYSNVGMTGPATFAMSIDVADLPPDDAFAIYAGWHAEHDEIFTVPADVFNAAQTQLARTIAGTLEKDGYASLRPQLLGVFLDEAAVVFEGEKDDKQVLVISDAIETIDAPTLGRARPLTAESIFDLYKGRKILRTFN